jgi:hypothetical protein
MANKTIPIKGMSARANEVAIEVAQFIGAVAPSHMFTDMQKATVTVHEGGAYWGKMSVPMALLNDVVNLPSNCGRAISFPDHNGPIGLLNAYYTQRPSAVMLAHLYSKFLPTFRGWQDCLQIANIPYAAVSLALEIPLKTVGAAVTHVPFKMWQYVADSDNATWKRGLMGVGAVFASLILYPLGMPFNIVGNVLGYARRAVDATVNLVSSGLAWLSDKAVSLFGLSSKYPKRYGVEGGYPTFTTSLKTLGKSIALAIGGGTIISGLINMAIIKMRTAAGVSVRPAAAGPGRPSTATAMAQMESEGGRRPALSKTHGHPDSRIASPSSGGSGSPSKSQLSKSYGATDSSSRGGASTASSVARSHCSLMTYRGVVAVSALASGPVVPPPASGVPTPK